MSELLINVEKSIYEILKKAIANAMSENLLVKADLPDFIVEIPSNNIHGDFSSNVALISAKIFKMPPLKIAEIIKSKLKLF